MKKITVLLFAFILLFLPFNTFAYEVDGYLENTFGEISVINSPGAGSNVIEESKLPLNTIMLKANFNQYVFKEWADYYSITLGTNFLSSSTNDTTIYQYTTNINNKESKLKGESDLDNIYFDLLLANYLLEYSTPNESYLVLIGFEYDNYSYDVMDGYYYDYGTDSKTTIGGKISYHQIQYHIPYLGLIFNRNFNNSLKNRFIFKFSPYAYTNNKSNNFYEDYTNDSKNTGNYLSLSNNIRYKLNKDMYITGGFKYKFLDANGKGSRYYYSGSMEGTTYDLKTDIESEEYGVNVGIQYLF